MAERVKEKLSEFDKQSFKFLSMIESVEFIEFIKWLIMMRDHINKVDSTLPTLVMDFSKDETLRAGIRLIINRSKISMIDDIINMSANIKNRYNKFANGEMEDSNAQK